MTDASTVVFVAHTGQVSGAEKVLLDLIGEAVRHDWSVIVVCPAGRLADALPDGVKHVRIDELGLGGEQGAARGRAAMRLLKRWWAASRVMRPIVTAPDTITVVNSLFALPVVRLARPPGGASWLVHDTMTSAKQRAVVAFARRSIRIAVAVSEATAIPLRAANVTVEVRQNGTRWPVDALGGELHEPAVVGILALLTPWKGHRVLLDAVGLLPGVRVEFAGGSFPGDAPHVAELHERAGRPDLDGRVVFLGHVDPSAVLRRWDVVVSASTSPEAGPLSVLEAMSHGLPVLGTDHGGTSEFLAGGAGVLVPPGNARLMADGIKKILADRDFRRELGESARRRVADRHDIAVTLPELLHTLTRR